MGLDAIESARPDGGARETGVVRPRDAQRRGIVMGNERFFEAKREAVHQVIAYASDHDDAEVSLMAAYLAPTLPDDEHAVVNVSYCLREVSRAAASRFDSLTDSLNDGRDVRVALETETCAAIAVLDSLRALLETMNAAPRTSSARPATAIESSADELAGLAWVELAEQHARDAGDAPLALALVYLRGSLTGDGRFPALNLADALQRLTMEATQALSHIVERDALADAVREHTATADAARRTRLLATGWRWLATMGEAT
jgi:hypothetical protein